MRRATVLRENAFDFYEHEDLGKRNAQEAPGWRAVWADRGLLGVAHLAVQLTPAMAIDAIDGLILRVGASRREDHFMEVHIYDAINVNGIEQVDLAVPLTDPEQREELGIRTAKPGAPRGQARGRDVAVSETIMSAHLSGPLGQALAIVDGKTRLFDADGEGQRPTTERNRLLLRVPGWRSAQSRGTKQAAAASPEIVHALSRETRRFPRFMACCAVWIRPWIGRYVSLACGARSAFSMT